MPIEARINDNCWLPFVSLIIHARASRGSAARSTSRAASRRLTWLVIVGWEHFSATGGSLILVGPSSCSRASSRAAARLMPKPFSWEPSAPRARRS